MVRSAGTSGGPSKKKKHPLPARSNAASSLEESRQRYKVSTFGSSGLRTNSGLCRGLKSLQHEITYPFPNFNGRNIEVWEWISNIIHPFTWHVITYPSWNKSSSVLVKGVPGLRLLFLP